MSRALQDRFAVQLGRVSLGLPVSRQLETFQQFTHDYQHHVLCESPRGRVRVFRHETCTVLCRAPGDAVLICLRDLDIRDEPLEACIGVAPDVALLVQHGTVVGWSLTDPARYLTAAYAEPDSNSPSPATRRLLTECLDLLTRWRPAWWCSRSSRRNPQASSGSSAQPGAQLAPAGRLVDRRLGADRLEPRTGTRKA
ncbi:hypothetical protein [Streptomyces mirabilis]|uniref:hypothetical protein n=1 Tax=Streptomyces mirabilis TaxID=68239 RepID=UPI00369E51DD